MAEENRRSVHLPGELQQEILLRLPCKSLIRFESVCKTWLSMLNTRHFINLYGQRAQLLSNPPLLHSISTESFVKMFPAMIDPPSCNSTKTTTMVANTSERGDCLYSVLGPLNGIYCIAAHYREEDLRGCGSISGTKIGLCNPATHDYKDTNPFPRKFHSLLPNHSSKRYRLHLGFGTVNVQRKKESNSNTLDYRVVVIIERRDVGNPSILIPANPSFLVFVYSLQRGAWKKIVDYEPGKRNDGKRKATEAFNIQGRRIVRISYPLEVCPQRFFKGCYYWIASVAGGEEGSKTWNVLAFNFADQSFNLIGGPPANYDLVDGNDGGQIFLLSDVLVLNDHLAVINVYSLLESNNTGVERTVEVCVWMMMEYGVQESWTKLLTINPNLDDELNRLYGIAYHPQTSGGTCIDRLFFEGYKELLISLEGECDCDSDSDCDSVGDGDGEGEDGDGEGENGGGGGGGGGEGVVFEPVCWNLIGISAYVETFERLNRT